MHYELPASRAETRESCIGRSKLCWQKKVKCCSLLLTLFVTKTVVTDDLYSFAQRRSITYLYSVRHNSDNEQTIVSISYTTIRVSTMINDTEMSVTRDHI